MSMKQAATRAVPEDELTLAASREDLRRALGRRKGNGADLPVLEGVSSEFPRSKLMRALFNEDLRWVWLAGATALTVVAGRRLGAAQQIGRWIGAYSLVRRLLDRAPINR
jgi:hypothetical protein